mmetsp:Transcript_4597/g.5273  ORF Transcript_4597/g.5273 Transcript_4597/m.5273 type:complete len:307 (+) Transcript_4597:202-1122(+)
MHLICATPDGRVVPTYVPDTATFAKVKENVAEAMHIPASKITLAYKGDNQIPDDVKLVDQGVANEDMILVLVEGQHALQPAGQVQAGQAAPAQQAATPMPAGGPPAQAIRTADGQFMIPGEAARELARQRMQMIQQNFEQAMEESPEAFASVYMLYIDVEINGHPVKAFVDSGAQTTVMSRECAERTGLIQLCDPRFAGIAQGVGTARILGRVHLAPMKIGEQFYNCSYSIMDSAQKVELLIGLDMLKKHHCNINLESDQLEIGTTGQKIKFLGESDLPEHAKLSAAAVHSLRIISNHILMPAFDI